MARELVVPAFWKGSLIWFDWNIKLWFLIVITSYKLIRSCTIFYLTNKDLAQFNMHSAENGVYYDIIRWLWLHSAGQSTYITVIDPKHLSIKTWSAWVSSCDVHLHLHGWPKFLKVWIQQESAGIAITAPGHGVGSDTERDLFVQIIYVVGNHD